VYIQNVDLELFYVLLFIKVTNIERCFIHTACKESTYKIFFCEESQKIKSHFCLFRARIWLKCNELYPVYHMLNLNKLNTREGIICLSVYPSVSLTNCLSYLTPHTYVPAAGQDRNTPSYHIYVDNYLSLTIAFHCPPQVGFAKASSNNRPPLSTSKKFDNFLKFLYHTSVIIFFYKKT
jgi:hypothetical protein